MRGLRAWTLYIDGVHVSGSGSVLLRSRPASPAIRDAFTWLGSAALALLVFSGQLKQTPSLVWVPLDLTLLSAVVVALCVIASRFRLGPVSGRIVVPMALFVSFLFGVFNASMLGHSAMKVALLFTVTLLLAIAPFYLLRTEAQREVFLVSLVAIGLFTAVATLLVDSVANDYSNRLALEGSDTIGTAQMVGAALIICFITVFRSGLTPFQRLLLVAAAGTMAYVALASGSRGPVVGVVLALLGVSFLSPGLRAYRVHATLGIVVVGGASVWWAIISGADGFTRIFGFLAGEGDASTEARASLWSESWAMIQENPFGTGWGSFSSSVFTYPHNIIVEVAVEAGLLVCVLLLIYLVASLIRLTVRSATLDLVTLLALLTFALFNAMVSSDINGNRLLWLMLSVSWVIGAEARHGIAPPPGATECNRSGRNAPNGHACPM